MCSADKKANKVACESRGRARWGRGGGGGERSGNGGEAGREGGGLEEGNLPATPYGTKDTHNPVPSPSHSLPYSDGRGVLTAGVVWRGECRCRVMVMLW